MRTIPSLFFAAVLAGHGSAHAEDRHATIARLASLAASGVIAIRHDIHAHPELSNREVRTGKLVARRLRQLGFDEVREGVAHTGVVAILHGATPGHTVALRADMDALPVTEETGLPYASHERVQYAGHEVGVMHACGHDAHVAILLGVAEVLAGMRGSLHGTIMLIFQPAEEGPPLGEEGGAELLVRDPMFERIKPPDVVFGLHVVPAPSGTILYRAGPMMAGSDALSIKIIGRQTHAAMPWRGIDPISVAGEVIGALQLVTTRETDIANAPVTISFGRIEGGVRNNIIPDEVLLSGTVRTLDPSNRDATLAAIRRRVMNVSASAGARGEVAFSDATLPVVNPPVLVERVLPSLRWAASEHGIATGHATMASDDFAVFQGKWGGFYFNLGVTPPAVVRADAAPNHSPHFLVDDEALVVGVRALSALAVDYLSSS